jgi:hypothetical protein
VQKKQISAVFLLFPIILAAVFGAYLYRTVGSSSASGCAQLVPDSSNITFFANSTIAGTLVNSSGGSSAFYRAGTCPQPVHQDLYQAISAVTMDPRFVRAENGTQFTVDPINSLSQPVQLTNGLTYQELIFNHLNLSDPIYPCNLNLIYSQPISAIYVFVPILANGSLNYDNETIAAYPGSQLQFYCPTETGLTTFEKSQIPTNFTVGGFSFNLVSNKTNFSAPNGTSYPGYSYAFNVTYGNSSGETQQAIFTWPSVSAFSSGQIPSPFIATPFGTPQGVYVVMRWFSNSTGTFLTVTTLA